MALPLLILESVNLKTVPATYSEGFWDRQFFDIQPKKLRSEVEVVKGTWNGEEYTIFTRTWNKYECKFIATEKQINDIENIIDYAGTIWITTKETDVHECKPISFEFSDLFENSPQKVCTLVYKDLQSYKYDNKFDYDLHTETEVSWSIAVLQDVLKSHLIPIENNEVIQNDTVNTGLLNITAGHVTRSQYKLRTYLNSHKTATFRSLLANLLPVLSYNENEYTAIEYLNFESKEITTDLNEINITITYNSTPTEHY